MCAKFLVKAARIGAMSMNVEKRVQLAPIGLAVS